MHWGSDGEGGCGQQWVGVDSGGGGGVNRGGSTFGVGCLQPVTTAIYTTNVSLQNSLSSNRAERFYEHLMPAGRYLFIPFLRTKIQKRQRINWSSEKSHKNLGW